LLALPAQASVFGPGHAVWKDARIQRDEFVRALLELRDRQLKEPSHLRLESPGTYAGKASAHPERNFLVIPVLYADGPQQGPVSQQELTARFFDSQRESSFTRYWQEVSGGRLIPRGRVLPWIRLPQSRSFYQNVFQGRPRLVGSRRLAEDAVCAAAPVLGPWWDFDDDGPDGIPGSGDDDGLIDYLIVLHPDRGIEIQVEENGMMALQDRMDPSVVRQECGVGADPFALASALDPLGILVHEAGHLLGLVDLYNLNLPADQTGDGYASGGLGLWSLMATGTWGGAGYDPTGLDAYSRSLLGWGEELPVDSTREAQLDAVAAPSRYVALAPGVAWGRERFLVEARAAQLTPRDGALPGEGVLIYRVDEDGRSCAGAEFPVVQLLQADGRQDLENHVNQGDASDVYGESSGNFELGPNTLPSSESQIPSPLKAPPRIRVSAAGPHRFTLQLEKSARAGLELVDARFGDGRVGLAPRSSQVWQLRFLPTSLAVISSARVRILSLGEGLTASTLDWVALDPGAKGYALRETIVLDAPMQTSALDAAFRLELEVNAASQTIEGGIPLLDGGGLPASSFARWQAEVTAPGLPATEFTPLSPSQTPEFGLSGWNVNTTQDYGYGDCCELQLVSPWIAVQSPADSILRFWSRVHSEASLPGEAWDGGVVEVQSPGGRWRALTPRGPDATVIVPLSRAATSGLVGFGGTNTAWTAQEALVPPSPLPLRLRFRFASDADGVIRDTVGGWSLAGARVGETPAEALLSLLSPHEALLRVTPAPDSLSASLWARMPPDADWQLLCPAQRLDARGETRFSFTRPSWPVLQLGAFVGSSTQILLATAGSRGTGQEFRARPNPASDWVNFVADAARSDRWLEIYDRRGRKLRRMLFPAGLGLVSWDGTDDANRRLASGMYLARLSPSRYKAISVTLIH
jgi:M6 family metalloprotease-like protein